MTSPSSVLLSDLKLKIFAASYHHGPRLPDNDDDDVGDNGDDDDDDDDDDGERVMMMMVTKIMMMMIFTPTSGSKKSNSGAQVYKEVSKFLKLVNLERKILVMWACKMNTSLI